MIDSKLLEILVCPESKQPVKMADDDLVTKLNNAIADGTIVSQSSEKVTETLDGALVTEDGNRAYPIRSDIPVMLIDAAISLDQLAAK